MKTAITRTVTEEIELPEFPFYLKKGEHQCFKIINEKGCIAVIGYEFDPSIQSKYSTAVALNDFAKCKIITEEEFKEFYQLVLKIIEKEL